MSTPPPRTPPRFIPTLTEVVEPAQHVQNQVPSVSAQDWEAFQQQMVHRVMQRVDLSFERRLREVVAKLVLEQTQTLAPKLRDAIEAMIRDSVSEAVAQELPQPPATTREN